MDAPRIAALLEPFLDRELASTQLAQISTYIDLLIRWNSRINLTAIREPEEIVTRHFGESLFMARHLFPDSPTHCLPERSGESGARPAESKDPYPSSEAAPASVCPPSLASSASRTSPAVSVIDLGSGAGFPALPLKIWTPEIHLTLIESNHKKAAFLREVARALTLTNIDVIAERAETLLDRHAPEFPKAGIVTFRAVENFDRTLPLAATFLSPTGRLALLIGAAQLPKLRSLAAINWQTTNVPKSQHRVLSIGHLS